MAIPDSPLTRSEEYLNNIATGEGAIPDVPLTRIEQYLDYIAKNGGSGGGGSGGGGAVYAMLTQDAETEVWSCDKTYAELKAAYDAGKTVFVNGIISDKNDGVPFCVPMAEVSMQNITLLVACAVVYANVKAEQTERHLLLYKVQAAIAENSQNIDASVFSVLLSSR